MSKYKASHFLKETASSINESVIRLKVAERELSALPYDDGSELGKVIDKALTEIYYAIKILEG